MDAKQPEPIDHPRKHVHVAPELTKAAKPKATKKKKTGQRPVATRKAKRR